jgi:2,4-dienoyl-CoA reductase (NADPH2)
MIGAGGIGFDVAELLTHAGDGGDPIAAYRRVGHRPDYTDKRGGLAAPQMPASPREVWLLQRKTSKVGDGLAKTTGWARRLLLQKRGVHMLGGVEYLKIDDAGLHIARQWRAERVLGRHHRASAPARNPSAAWSPGWKPPASRTR